MKKFKGTPAPWKLIKHSWSDRSIISDEKTIVTNSIYDECEDGDQNGVENETTANLRLIAAAPELLDALIKIVNACNAENIEWLAPEYGIAMGAIEKALGERLTPTNPS